MGGKDVDISFLGAAVSFIQWVGQECKILTAVYLGHFSGLCLQGAALMVEVRSLSRVKNKFADFFLEYYDLFVDQREASEERN